jgi:hypothetical protein
MENRLSAKHKLNSAYFLGAVLTAGLLASINGSMWVFVIALVAMLVAGFHARELRK